MPRSVTVVTIFLASPMDVERERDIVSESIRLWNELNRLNRSLVFEFIRWESSISAGFGKDGQDVINQQVADRYDLLIALFWNRFGTETPRAASGTAEEYERALDRHKKGEEIEIAFYFKEAEINPRLINFTQLNALLEFEKRVQNEGALTKRFSSHDGLRFEINLLLDRISRKYAPSYTSHASIDNKESSINDDSPSTISNNDARVAKNRHDLAGDLGLFDITENMTLHANDATNSLGSLINKLTWLGGEVERATSAMNAISSVRTIEPSDAKPIIAQLSGSMDECSNTIESELPTFTESTVALATDIRALIDVSYDFVDNGGNAAIQIAPFRSTIAQMLEGIQSSITAYVDFVDTVVGLQRTTSVFNKARRRLVQNLKSVIVGLQATESLVVKAMTEIDALLLYMTSKQ